MVKHPVARFGTAQCRGLSSGVLSPHSSPGFEQKISDYSLRVFGSLHYGCYLVQPHIYKMGKGTKNTPA